MNTIEQRVLRGPNLFSRRPCVQTLADLGQLACALSSDLPGFDEELLALFPGMRDFEEPLVHGSLIAEVIGRVALELQRIGGAAPDVPFSTFMQCRQAQVRIVVSYQLEKVGVLAVDSAMRIVQALCQGEHIVLGDYLDPLRASAKEGAIGTSTAAVVDAAAWRGIPAIRIAEDANLFQLGWGSRQKRLQATMTSDASHIAVGIAADQQLTRALLEQGGIPVVAHGAHIEGRDYRVLVAGNKVAAASLRRAPCVPGDGVSTVQQLADADNLDPGRGGGAEDVTGLLHPATAQMCIRAARLIGLDVAGIDLVCGDIAQPLRGQGGAVIAVNAAPGICMHEFPSKGRGQPAGDAIVEAMFGQGDGRIPVIAVTGTNGKTTTSLMIAHCTRLAGLSTGVTTSEGVYINGQRIIEGDCAGYQSARVLLASPEVDIAVLETARGGILKRGLAFDRCSVAVVLNVSSDHLGLDGIETLDDMARVKAVVARAAAGTVVLNADDRHCLHMEKQIEADVERIYFSMEPENPVLLHHLEKRGRAAYFQDNALILADGARRSELLKAWAMPAALHGHARHNVANALAAAAALMGAGIAQADIRAGLSTFVSDRATKPLRSNIMESPIGSLVR